MASKMYKLNPDLYKKNGSRRPGATCDRVNTYVRTDDGSQTDRKNREIVAKKMVQYVKNGIEPEKAAVILANNARVKKVFEYLINAGVDLKELFVNLYVSEINRKNTDKDITRE